MKRFYKNTLDLNWTPDPAERRRNISKEIVRHADYMPKTLGYEDIDRYRSGELSCDSYLFLSPLNHSDIQVNGDTNKSNVLIKSNEFGKYHRDSHGVIHSF